MLLMILYRFTLEHFLKRLKFMSSKKLIVKFQGGLGNQLYDYAFYEWLKREYPEYSVLADLSYFKIRMAHDDLGSWNIFSKMKLDLASNWEIFKSSGQIPIFYGGKGADRLNALRDCVNKKLFQNRRYAYISSCSNQPAKDVKEAINKGYIHLEGYWQNVEYIMDNLGGLRQKLQFPEECNKYITEEMLKDNAVSLHVRRGDYVGSAFEKEVGMSYYKAAVDFMSSNVKNAKFFIFTDDKEYAETAFDWIENKTVVKGYDNKLAHVDMLLMSKIKNNIIANSTFSVWAAYLNEHKDSIVVYPDVKTMEKKAFPSWQGIKLDKEDL